MAGKSEEYKILKCINVTNNSTVYTATNVLTNNLVAIKKLNTTLIELSNLVKLKNEYNLLLKIKSDFVVKAIDYFKLDDSSFLVMEFCDGITLAEYITQHRVTIKEFLYMAMKIASGLSDIHKNDVIHKDINPSNIIYDPRTRRIKIIDFGIATEMFYEKPQELNPNSFEGTIDYISPEQTGRMSRLVDYRTDFYSVGVTFYEMLCSRRPFVLGSPAELVHSHLAKTPPAAHEINPSIPIVISKIISKLMSKMPEDRYNNADGLIHDIKQCLKNITPDEQVEMFELGCGDYTDKFEIPKKLYGREKEVSRLMDCFAHILTNGKELVTINGYSGTGKTSLVNELQKPIINSNGIFLSGKLNQYQRNVPYSAFSQVMDQFCSFVLSEPENKMMKWKAKLAEACKRDGKLLSEKLPLFELLIGEQPDLPELTPIEERIRIKKLIQNVLMTIASPEHPLVIFIDDFQLVDIGFLEVVEEILMNKHINCLLIIVCFRENEVEAHPLAQSLKKIKSGGGIIERVHLASLNLNATWQMVADTLHREKADCEELTKIVYRKTHGNPLYIKQFLKHCHSIGLINYDCDKMIWQWNQEGINNCLVQENMTDFLIQIIMSFPESTLKMLSLGACISHSFSIDILSHISGEDINEILLRLKPAVSAEIIYPLQEDTEFQFTHDRFQQACYAILSEEQKSKTHIELARYYEKAPGNKLFLIADNYSKALKIIESKDEKSKVADILLRAAHAASLLSAFDSAERFLKKIIDECADAIQAAPFRFAVYAEYHAVLCTLGQYDRADEVYNLLIIMVDDPLSLADPTWQQVWSLGRRGKYRDAFMLGAALLKRYGIHYTENDLAGTVNTMFDEGYEDFRMGNHIDIDRSEEAADDKEHAIAKVLDSISMPGFLYDPMAAYWAIFTNAKRMLIYGYTPEGLHLYANLITPYVILRNDYRLGYQAALTAMKLAEKKNHMKVLYRIYMIFSLKAIHWREDIKNSIPYAREAFKGDVEAGDFEYAGLCYFSIQTAVLECCNSIEELNVETEAAISFAEKIGYKNNLDSFISFRQLYRALKGVTFSEGSFNNEQFSEQSHAKEIDNNGMALCFFYVLRALAAVIYSDFDTAFFMTEKSALNILYNPSNYLVAMHYFLHSLAICKRIENCACSAEEIDGLLNKLSSNQKWLKARAADAPVNFLHLYHVIEAEVKCIEGKYFEAVKLYEISADEAVANNRSYHYALICELAALNLMKINLNRTVSAYLKESYLSYLSFEATGKVEQMKRKYESLLSADFYRSEHGSGKKNTGCHSSGATGSIDLNSTLKAAEAIAGEMLLESILEKLIYVLLENAGAQNIYFLTKKSDHYEILVEGNTEANMTAILKGRIARPDCMPFKIINYVERTHESIVLDNASELIQFGDDEYLVNSNCKSVMCMPVLYKGELKGLLYFENNLVEGAFNREHIEILKIIASPLGIAMENAHLYNNLKELVEERTRELKDEIKVRKNAEKLLQEMANQDHLTGLPNRRMFQEILSHSIELAELSNTAIGVLFIDLDGFKAVNDKLGHDKGDHVLITAAKRLSAVVRNCDAVSRIGGDEFIIVLENLKSVTEVKAICKRILMALKDPIIVGEDGVKATVSASIGVSIYPFDGILAEVLIRNADMSMYRAKKEGKNKYVFHSEKYKIL